MLNIVVVVDVSSSTGGGEMVKTGKIDEMKRNEMVCLVAAVCGRHKVISNTLEDSTSSARKSLVHM